MKSHHPPDKLCQILFFFMQKHVRTGKLLRLVFPLFELYNFIHLSNIMSSRNEINCGCMGSTFNPQESLFLMRKKQVDQSQLPPQLRRTNKSTQSKKEQEGKSMKKSLKKRPASPQLSHQMHYQQSYGVNPFEFNQIGNELKINFEASDRGHLDNFSFYNIDDNSHKTSRIGNVYNLVDHQMVRQQATKILTYDEIMTNNIQFRPSANAGPYAENLQQRNKEANFQTMSFKDHHSIGHSTYNQTINNHTKASTNMPHHLHQQESPFVQKVHFPKRAQQTESWIPKREDPLIIQQFDRLFKNRQQHQSHANLLHEKPHMKLREVQKSKKFQKQLIGRFAESDEEQRSDSPPSQVIGRGFEQQRRLEDFWEDQIFLIQENIATKSTNTKLSEQKRPLNDFEGEKLVNFGTSYKPRTQKYL